MRPAPLFFVGLLGLALAAASSSARGQTPAPSAPPAQPVPTTRAPHPALLHVTVDLDFKLGPGLCPGGEAFVHQEVRRRLGWNPFEPMPDGVPRGRINSVIARAPGGLIANFERVDAAGVRQWDVTYHELGAGPQACERLIRSIAIEIVPDHRAAVAAVAMKAAAGAVAVVATAAEAAVAAAVKAAFAARMAMAHAAVDAVAAVAVAVVATD